jgi:hypothetical protein
MTQAGAGSSTATATTRLAQVQCTLYVPRAELEAWFDRAKAGETRVYARGPSLNPRHEVPMLVRDWYATGEATLCQSRDQATREVLYHVRRIRPQPADGAARRVKVDDAWRETAEGRIFLTLVRAANMGIPCPSNADLARAGGLRDADAGRYVLYKLRDAGRVEILPNAGARGGRVVKIVETGRVTAEASGARV